MNDYIEQTAIARKLGISNKAFQRIAYYGGLEFKLINNKRHYELSEVLAVIKKAKI